MAETANTVTMKGKPLSLEGRMPAVGQSAPDFAVVGNDLSPVKLSDFRGKVVLISSVPSLDTSVCAIETRRFNQEAAALGDKVAILTISMDLPFAQKRWCGAEGVKAIITASDHREAAFGRAYGVLIKELRLLARAIFVVGRDGKICYRELVREVTSEPDYAAALKAAADAAK